MLLKCMNSITIASLCIYISSKLATMRFYNNVLYFNPWDYKCKCKHHFFFSKSMTIHNCGVVHCSPLGNTVFDTGSH